MENQTPDAASAPATLLAERIIQQLFEQGLIREQDKALFIQNLAEGRLREADWRSALTP